METTDLERYLHDLAAPDVEPGPHRDELRAELHAVLQAGPGDTARPRRWPIAMAAVLVIVLAGGSAPYWVPRLITSFSWHQNDWIGESAPLEGLPEQYHAEARQIWDSGEAAVLNRLHTPDGATVYSVELVFQDGYRHRVGSALPPDPKLRAELRRIVAAGQGEVALTTRTDDGLLVYMNHYSLSNGEVVSGGSGFPPLSTAEQTQAQEFIDQQTKRGAGTVVGRLNDHYVIEYTLPDGRPHTNLRSTPPAQLTEARETEIFALKARGDGRLVRHAITSFGDAYIVEYELSDGSLFRVGEDRPPMSAAEWELTRAEVQAKYQAGHFEEQTVDGADGKPVQVLVFTLADGERIDIPNVPEVKRCVWGLQP